LTESLGCIIISHMRISKYDLEQLTEIFLALAHPLRLRLARMLLHRPMCVSRLAMAVGAPQPTVSRNLSILRRAGLVRREQCGAFVRYGINDSIAGVSLQPLHELIVQFVADEYDEEAVDLELERRGIRVPERTDN